MLVIGMDVGTTATKAVAYDQNGQMLASARRGYTTISPRPGYLELDPHDVSQAIREVIGSICDSVGKGRVCAICSAALGEAIVPLERDGNCLDNTIVALDARAIKQTQDLREYFPESRFYQLTGQNIHPILSLAKVLWWRKNKPDVFTRSHKFCCWNEMLCQVLGVSPAISPSLAARTGFYDLGLRDWSEEILDYAGLTKEQLARIVPAGEVIEQIPSRIVEELGLASGCVLVSGGWDQVCSALGSGAIEAGTLVNSIGSTDSLNATFSGTESLSAMQKFNLTCTPHAVEGLFCTVAFSLNGGNLVQWYRETFDKELSDGEFFSQLAHFPPSDYHQTWVLPHFVGSGTPYMDAQSMGAILGLSFATQKQDILHGIVESITFEMAENLANLRSAQIPVYRILASSGGAASPPLLQLRANVFGEPITPLLDQEAGCLACGMLAWLGRQDNLHIEEMVKSWVKRGVALPPQPDLVTRYEQKMALYRLIYPTLRELNHQLHKCSQRETG